MAKIIWEENATHEYWAYVENAGKEYGKTTAQRWQKERKAIEWRLERFPDSYPPEDLLLGRDILYRRCHLMNRRFKIIYYYDHFYSSKQSQGIPSLVYPCCAIIDRAYLSAYHITDKLGACYHGDNRLLI